MIGAGHWALALVVFALASVGFFAGSSFQDALIVQVATPAQANRVSALGFALGYLGGGLLFLVNVVMVLHPHAFHLSDATRGHARRLPRRGAVVGAVHAAAVPGGAGGGRDRGGHRLGDLWSTIRQVLSDRPVLHFLLAYWLYIDGIATLQQMAVDFGAKLGFSTSALIQALLLVQFVSFPCALLFGRLGDRIGPRRAIYLGLAVFVAVTVYAYFMRTERQFYVLAAIVGTVQGGVQALSRSYFTRLIPPERSGAYFGCYNMLAKFAAVLGPLAMGVVAIASGNQRLSILVLLLFFAGGAALLARVRDPAPALSSAPGRGTGAPRGGTAAAARRCSRPRTAASHSARRAA